MYNGLIKRLCRRGCDSAHQNKRERIMQNNTPENLILLCGELLEATSDSYFKNDTEYVEFSMKIILPTGTDILPVAIPKHLVDDTVVQGAVISVTGTLVSEETFVEDEQTLSIKVLVSEVYAGETEITSGVFLTGNILKKPYSYPIKDTMRAEFEITVGSHNALSRVPVSAVGECASIAESLQLGDPVSLLGQLHSYEYFDISGEQSVTKTGYEVEVLTFTALPKI